MIASINLALIVLLERSGEPRLEVDVGVFQDGPSVPQFTIIREHPSVVDKAIHAHDNLLFSVRAAGSGCVLGC